MCMSEQTLTCAIQNPKIKKLNLKKSLKHNNNHVCLQYANLQDWSPEGNV